MLATANYGSLMISAHVSRGALPDPMAAVVPALIVAAHAKCGNEVVNEPLPQFMTAAMLRQAPPAKILIMT